MSHEYIADAMNRSNRRIMRWYQNNLIPVLQDAKERHVREIDASINIAKELMRALDEKVPQPVEVPLHNVVPFEKDDLMKPIEPEVEAILYSGTEKGADKRYLKERNKKSPEDKFYFRVVTSWDYGWQQKQSRMRARDVNHGRCAILRDTFYRKNNLGPDPRHYSQPAGGEVSICSEYSCDAT